MKSKGERQRMNERERERVERRQKQYYAIDTCSYKYTWTKDNKFRTGKCCESLSQDLHVVNSLRHIMLSTCELHTKVVLMPSTS